MKLKTYFTLFFFGVFIFGCADNSRKESDLIQREKELLEREREILKEEHALLESKQKEDEKQIKEEDYDYKDQQVLPNYTIENLVGFWTIYMNCIVSDCTNIKPGDIRTEIWQINQTDGKIVVKVSNSDTKVKEYEGQFSGNKLTLKLSRAGSISNSKVSVKISFQNTDEMTGEREVLNGSSSGVCKIEYSIKAKRQESSPGVEF